MIENDQIAKIKKEGDTWIVEPKAIVILKHGQTANWLKTLGAKPIQIESGADELRMLLKERQHSTIRELENLQILHTSGKTDHSQAAFDAAKRYVDSTLEFTEDSAERIELCRRFLEFAQDLEWALDLKRSIGTTIPLNLERAIQARIDAEILLLKEQRRAK
jgi:hypothetical protein